MKVIFRDVDPFNLWVWAQLKSNASTEEKEMLEEVLKAWFILGKLGGFNAMRLQVQRHTNAAAASVSNMRYELDDRDDSAAFFHAMSDCEYKDNWMRCWCACCVRARAVSARLIRCCLPRQGSTWAPRTSWRWTCSSTRCPASAKSARVRSGTRAACGADAPPARRHLPITQLVIGGINADWKEGADALRKQLDAE
jgi:hypothetical protein